MSEDLKNETNQENTETTEPQQEDIKLYAGKYKDVDNLEKGYKELESRFGSFKGAPKDGYKLGEDVDPENDIVKFVQEWGKENNLTNDGLNSLVSKYTELQEATEQQRVNGEIEKLGEEGKARVQKISDWAKANIPEDKLDAFGSLATTSDQFEALESIIGLTKSGNIANEKQDVSTSPQSIDKAQELRDLQFATDDQGRRLMEFDMSHRAKVDKLYKEFYD